MIVFLLPSYGEEHVHGPDCNHETESVNHETEGGHVHGPDCNHETESVNHEIEGGHVHGPDCNHEHGEDGECGVGHYHDPYLMDSVVTQPWRHPEKVGKDLWLTKIAPISILFIAALLLRPLINKILKEKIK